MNRIDLTPLYRNSIGYDRFASLLDSAFKTESTGYPPYNIEVLNENQYSITIAVAGFKPDELHIEAENHTLTVSGKQQGSEEKRHFLHQGIATRSFERKFNLAEFVEVTDAVLNDGLLTINLVKELPETMKPKTIAINSASSSQPQLKQVDSEAIA